MNRLIALVRTSWRAIGVAGVAALVLAGCNSAAVAPKVTGIPSIGISVPLRTVACTLTGSCVALGTTGSDLTPSTVGEYRENNGTWSSLVVPSAPSAVLTSSSCWSTGCLVGGIQPSGTLLWSYNASSQSVSVRHAPGAGQAVRALSCFSSANCAVVLSTGINETTLLSFTSDGGASWSTNLPLTWSIGETVTDIECTDSLDCMVSAATSSNAVDVEVTHDAGVTWTARTTPSSWTSLSSLWCTKLQCVALAHTSSTSLLVRTSTFGRVWKTVALSAQANALACTAYRHCVLGGEKGSGNPWLATYNDAKLVASRLKYVPSPIEDVACALKVCTAIGVSTVLALRP